MVSKYFIYHKEHLEPATANKLLRLLYENCVSKSDQRLADLADDSPSESDVIVEQAQQEHFAIQMNKTVFGPKPSFWKKLNSLTPDEQDMVIRHLTAAMKNISDNEIEAIIKGRISEIQNTPNEALTKTLDNIFAELQILEKSAAPNVNAIYFQNRQRYTYQQLTTALSNDSRHFYFHGQETVSPYLHHIKNPVVECIQNDVNQANVAYQGNQIVKRFYQALLSEIVIFYPENELHLVIKEKLSKSNHPNANELLTVIDNIHQHPNMSEFEKIMRYFFTLSLYKNHLYINDMIISLYHTNDKMLFIKYCQLISNKDSENLMQKGLNISQVILQHFSEQRKGLYNYFIASIANHHENSSNSWMNFASWINIAELSATAHQLLHNKSDLMTLFGSLALRDEISKEMKILTLLDQYYLGTSSVEETKTQVRDVITEFGSRFKKE